MKMRQQVRYGGIGMHDAVDDKMFFLPRLPDNLGIGTGIVPPDVVRLKPRGPEQRKYREQLGNDVPLLPALPAGRIPS